jgi:hypothetical protein
MSFAFVQNKNTVTASASSASVTMTSSVTAGNLVVACVGVLNGSTSTPIGTSVADNKGNIWILSGVHTFTQGGNLGQTVAIWHAIATTGGSSFQVTLTPASAGFLDLSVCEYSFSDTGYLQVYSASQNKQTATASVNTGTLTHNGSASNLMVGMICRSDGTQNETWSAGTSTNLRASHSFVGGSAVGFASGDSLNPSADQAINVSFNVSATGSVTEAFGVTFSFNSTAQPYRYLATFFDGFNRLCVCGNNDGGATWNALPGGGWKANYPLSGSDVCRDPSSVFKVGSTYFVAHSNTNGTATNTVTICSSTDLITWAFVCRVDYSAVIGSSNSNRCVVGPQFFRDAGGDIYLFAAGSATYFTSISSNVVMWCKATDTTGLSTWGAASSLTLTGSDTTGPLDPFLVLVSGTYYLYYAHLGSGTNNVTRASSATVTGTYAEIDQPFTTREGPCPVNMGGSNWRIWLDALGAGQYFADTSGGISGSFGSQTGPTSYLTNTQIGMSVVDGNAFQALAYAAALLPAM